MKKIRAALASEVPQSTVQFDLTLLRELDLVDSYGKGPGARWMLKGVAPA